MSEYGLTEVTTETHGNFFRHTKTFTKLLLLVYSTHVFNHVIPGLLSLDMDISVDVAVPGLTPLDKVTS